MNARLSKLLIASLSALMLSGQALAGSRFMDSDFLQFSVGNDRLEREYGKRDKREQRKAGPQEERKDMQKPEGREQERGYGYGYERRYQHQRHDDRGRN